MRNDCIQAITQAADKLGRTLTAADLRGIEGNIRQALRDNARENLDAYRQQTPAEQLRAAADRVAKDIVAEKTRAAANVARQIVAHDRNQQFVNEQAGKGMRRINAVRRLLTNWGDNKAGVRSLEQNREGLARLYKAKMEPIARATERFFGFFADKTQVRDVLHELYGEDSGNAKAKDVAKIWSDQVAEPMRKQFNELGGNIRKLKDWAVPQSHSQFKVAKAGLYQWLADVLPKLDREAYVNTDGSLMTDNQMRAMLGDVHLSIATDGAWNSTVNEGAGAIKNRMQDRRVLHFRDAQSYIDYQKAYGEKSLLETMTGHVDSMASQIAALQTFGPNAEASFKQLLNAAKNVDSSAGDGKASVHALQAEKDFQVATGQMGATADPKVAHAFQVIRSTLALIHLGGAALSAITDSANMVAIARSWNIPAYRAWAKFGAKAWSSTEYRQFMRSQGVGVEAITHAVSRFGEDTFGHGIASNLANAQFRVSGLNFLDMVRRVGTGAMLYSRIGDLLGAHTLLGDAHPADVRELMASGTDEKTWAVWKQADIDPQYGLTPKAIAEIPDAKLAAMGNPEQLRRDAAQHLVGAVARSVDQVVPMMTNRTQAWVEQHAIGGAQRGTVGGELQRSVMQFKSFPIAMIANNWQKLIAQPGVKGKALYAVEVAAVSSILGALSIQLKSLVAGNNPQDMSDPKFAGRAVVQGGALGILGDLTINPWASPYKQELQDQLGPLAGELIDMYKLAQDIGPRADPTKKQNLGGDLTRFAQRNLPGANLFYTKAAVQHLLFQRLQDYFSPGYASRMQQRTQQYYNSGQWWAPSTAASPKDILAGSTRGITTPQAPNLRTALGERQ